MGNILNENTAEVSDNSRASISKLTEIIISKNLFKDRAKQFLHTCENIPQEMLELPNWLIWHSVEREGQPKPAKVPLNPKTGQYASVTNPDDCINLEKALIGLDKHKKALGLGFVLNEKSKESHQIIFIDLDNCRNPGTGEWSEQAKEIVASLKSYTEVSQSGKGLHIFLKAHWDEKGRRLKDLEAYSTERYCAVTGNIQGVPPGAMAGIQERQDKFDAFVARYLAQEPQQPAAIGQGPPEETTGGGLSDEEIIERLKKLEKAAKLWEGDTFPANGDHSAADAMLLSYLAFWTAKDPEQMERIFSQSGLAKRKKWTDRQDYQERSIAAAITNCQQVYTGKYPDSDIEAARSVVAQVTKITSETVFAVDVLRALSVLKSKAFNEYVKFKESCRGKVNLNDLERTVNFYMAAAQAKTPVETKTTKQAVPDAPADLVVPSEYTFTEQGVRTYYGKDQIVVCPVPVLLTGILANQDTGTEKVIIAWKRGGRWHKESVLRSVAFSSRNIIQLTDRGLPTSSESAKQLVKWLSALEGSNLDTLQTAKAVSTMGWHGDYVFLPGLENGIILDSNSDGEAALAEGYKPSGTIEDWLTKIEQIRNYPLARLILAASFAAPLLKIFNQRVFLLHIWGGSTGGKTAAMYAALSAWGDPDDLVFNFNSTDCGIERTAAFYKDLPLALDERQIRGKEQEAIEAIAYVLGSGKGKRRGSKTGLQTTSKWRTIAITTGEETITSHNTLKGVFSRVLEPSGRPIPNTELAADVYRWTKTVHGTAGPEFMRRFIAKYPPRENYLQLQETHETITKKIGEEYPSIIAAHRSAAATLLIADALFNELLLGMDDQAAAENTMDFVPEVMGMMTTNDEADDGNRAWEFISGWLAKNNARFQDGAKDPLGFIKKVDGHDCIYIESGEMNKILSREGLSPRKILAELAEASHLLTFKAKEKTRYSKQERWNGARPWFNVLIPEKQSREDSEDTVEP